MISVGQIYIEDEVINSHFACDLNACKGGCCTFPGEYGAPVTDEEVPEMAACVDAVRDLLPPEHLEVIDRDGIVEGFPGLYTTVCVNKKACVFVYYDGEIAKCALEKAYFEGRIKFRKPVSCHLFPVRIRNHGSTLVRYEVIDECAGGRKLGEKRKINLYDFLKDALSRRFGEEWYKKFRDEISQNIKRD